MRREGTCYIYDADDEEPDCLTCDDCCTGDVFYKGSKVDYCSTFCGPEHYWARYKRTEELET